MEAAANVIEVGKPFRLTYLEEYGAADGVP